MNNIETKTEIVRKYCYRGVGTISYLSSLKDNQKVVDNNISASGQNLFALNDRYSAAIIKLILRGMDDSSQQCVKETLASFQKIVDSLNPDLLLENLSDFLNKLRNSFER